MSAGKKDRTTAPRLGSRPSRAKEDRGAGSAPPRGYRRAGKPKPGERTMQEQLADIPARDPVGGTTTPPTASGGISQPHEQLSVEAAEAVLVPADPDDAPPTRDPWWTDEREKAFAMVLAGAPQHQVAAELGRDRHTVARWLDDERFVDRLLEENEQRFRASRQRRSIQTVRLTDKVERLAVKMLDKATALAEKGKDDLGIRLGARDWLNEFRENSRREDELFGLAGQRVDVRVQGGVDHRHKHSGGVAVSFKAFLTTSLRAVGVDPDAEEVDAGRADEALAALAERALREGSFLDDLVEQENEQKLAPLLADR